MVMDIVTPKKQIKNYEYNALMDWEGMNVSCLC